MTAQRRGLAAALGYVLLLTADAGAQVVLVVDERPKAGGAPVTVVLMPLLPVRGGWPPPLIEVVISEDPAASRRRTDAMFEALAARVVEQETACGREAREWAWPACEAFLRCQAAGKAAARRGAVNGFKARDRCSTAYYRALRGHTAELDALRAEAEHFERCQESGPVACAAPSPAPRTAAQVDWLTRQVEVRTVAPTRGCSRPSTIAIERWNFMTPNQQAAACGTVLFPPVMVIDDRPREGCSRPSIVGIERWNFMTADQQAAACRAAAQRPAQQPQ